MNPASIQNPVAPRPAPLRLTPEPTSQAPSPTLTEAQLAELERAHRHARPMRRGARVASMSAWTSLALGALAAPFALGDLGALALALALIACGYNELSARRALVRMETSAPARLAINQLALGAVFIAYAAFNLYRLGPIPPVRLDVDGMIHPGGSVNEEAIDALSRLASGALYLGLIIGTILVQGSTALFYITRRRPLRRFLSSTPAWVVETMRALRTL
ncbi:MAG: hypothetical protein ACIARR_05725 [Phycisphaerales bacterium JB059]